MNFLGHCYLCQNHMHLTTGNLGGDFYKGNLSNFQNLPGHIQQGIKFHRFIDDFTDHSQSIAAVAHIFQQNGIAKVSYIACDILLDHYLSKNWNQYSAVAYTHFVEQIYDEVNRNLDQTGADFRFLFNKMQVHGWFYDYPDIAGITKILRQFSHRMAFPNALAESSTVYLNHQKTIDNYFKTFLKEIKDGSEQFILEHKLGIS